MCFYFENIKVLIIFNVFLVVFRIYLVIFICVVDDGCFIYILYGFGVLDIDF